MDTLGPNQMSFLENLPKNFTFINRNEKYQCNAMIACILSPIISQAMIADNLLNSYTLDVDDPQNCFPVILQCAVGKPCLLFSDSLKRSFRDFGYALGNKDLLLLGEDKCSFNSFDDAIISMQRKNDNFLPIDDEIDYIASNFSSITKLQLSQFSYVQLQNILASPSLIIKKEDHFFDQLLSWPDIADYPSLLLNIYPRKLSPEKSKLFFSQMSQTPSLLSILRNIENYHLGHKQLLPKGIIPLHYAQRQGIFKFLFDRCGNNPCFFGYVSIKSSSIQEDRSKPIEDIINVDGPHSKKRFISKDLSNQSITIDMNQFKIYPEHFEIDLGVSKFTYPQKIKISASNDPNDFTASQEIVFPFQSSQKRYFRKGKYPVKPHLKTTFNFPLKLSENPEHYRYIKIEHVENFDRRKFLNDGIHDEQIKNEGAHSFVFSTIEFYGTLTIP